MHLHSTYSKAQCKQIITSKSENAVLSHQIMLDAKLIVLITELQSRPTTDAVATLHSCRKVVSEL